MTQYPDLFAALAAPFEGHEVKTRTQAGRQLSYITARTAMNRLDNVVGPESWWDEYVPMENSVVCKLTIRLPDGQLLTKVDAGGHAGMSDEGDDEKSGFSDAFKRACVKMGIGRYLYRDGVPAFAREAKQGGTQRPKIHEPESRAPGRKTSPAASQGQPEKPPAHPDPSLDRPIQFPDVPYPKTGRTLFGFLQDCGKIYSFNFLGWIQKWGMAQKPPFPVKVVDWDAEQVKLGLARCVNAITKSRPEAPENEHPVIAMNRLAATPSASSEGGKKPDEDQLRSRLTGLVWDAAMANSKTDNPGDDDFLAAMDMLADACGFGELNRLDDLDMAGVEKMLLKAQIYVNENRRTRSA